MKVLLEASHPAHVHFFTPIGRELLRRGNDVLLALRDKDVVLALAERTGIPTSRPSSGRWSGHQPGRGILARGPELVSRVRWLRSLISAEGFDVVATRNPSGVLAARIAGVASIFDTDDGRAAGMHYWLAGPFASVVTSPELLPERLGPHHETYPGLKATFFLHPARFSPDAGILRQYGLKPDDRLFVTRFSANDASHDSGARLIPDGLVAAICKRLRLIGDVVLSREGRETMLLRRLDQPPGIGQRQEIDVEEGVQVAPEHFLNLLAHAELFVGDSGSVAMESVALGVPALRIADVDRPILAEIERQVGTLENFRWSESARLLLRIDETVQENMGSRINTNRINRSSAPFDDLVGWYVDLIERVATANRPQT